MRPMNRYIFLDVDGVLNQRADWTRLYVLNPKNLAAFGAFLDLLRETDAVHVVLSTNWRLGFSPRFSACSAPIREVWQFLRTHGVVSVDATPQSKNGDRGAEIGEYIRNHSIPPPACVVVDDDRELFRTPLPAGGKVIYTDARYGFREGDGRHVVDKEDSHGSFEIAKRICSFFRY